MSELAILYYSADESIVTPILTCLNELGIESVTHPIDGAEVVAFEILVENSAILICWSPALVAASVVNEAASGALVAGKLISCRIAPCQLPPSIDTTEDNSFTGWCGKPDAPEWLALVARIAGILQRPGLIELSRALTTGTEQDRFAFAKRYPDEPVAKDIWKHREIKHRQAFEHSLAFARANFDRHVRMEWKKIEDTLKVYKTEFEIWLEEERLGNSKILPQPHLLTANNPGDFDSAGEAEAKASALADQLAREYARRRELSDRAARLELQLQQSEAAATLKLQIANREIEAAHRQAQSVEREHAAIVVERNILNHGQAALRSELERRRTSPRRYRILASILITVAVASSVFTSRFWPQGRSSVARQDSVATASEAVGDASSAARRIANLAVTKENVGALVNEAMKVAPGAVITAFSHSARNDLFAGVQNEDLNLLATRFVRAVPQIAVAEVIRVLPNEVVESAIQSARDIVVSDIVGAAPEAVLRELSNESANTLVAQVVANYPAAIVAEFMRTNATPVVTTLVKNQPELLLSEMLKSAPGAIVDGTVRAYPTAVADRLLNVDSGQFITEITKLMPDKLLTELLRTNSNQVITQVVRNFSFAVASEMLRTDPNSVVSAALRLDPSHVIAEATRLAPDVVISEALRSNLSAVALQAIKMAPASLIAEMAKARPAELTSFIAKTYPSAVTTEILKYSPEIVVAEVLKTRPNLLTTKMATADPPVTSELAKTTAHHDSGIVSASEATRSSNSELINLGQSTVTTEEIAQAPAGAVRNMLSNPTKLAGVSTSPPIALGNQDNKAIKDCDICPKLVTIAAGTAFVGLKGEEKLSSDISDRSLHGRLVSLAAPFALSESKITVAQFKSFMIERRKSESSAETCRSFARRSSQKIGQLSYLSPGFEQGDTHPVVCVSWNDAVEYTHWLSEKTGMRYRLPTEAEWEYSARAGSQDEWRAGESLTESCRFGNILDVSAVAKKAVANGALAASCSDQWVYTSPQGAFPANGFGLFDMYGNAHEWVEDCWNDDLSTLPADGTARTGENGSPQCASEMRVRRGSAWTTPPAASGLAARWKGTESHAFQDTGFRVLRELN